MNAPYEFVLARYNDPASVDAVIAGLPKDSLAAIIVEPMQGAGGCIPGQPQFLHHLRKVADEQSALLILDEVMTSRLAYGGIQSTIGLKPDLTTLGKWIGGGMSFGAFGGRHAIMDMFDPRRGQLVHSGTFNNNVFTMAAGIAGCSLFDKDAVDRLNAKGDSLRNQINETIEEGLPARKGSATPVMFALGIGSLCNVSFTGSQKTTLQALFFHHMLDHGIYLATRGFCALSLENTDEHIAKFVNAVEKFVKLYQKSIQET
jgi:glutamate-1-semialdehyde 2,1-aminomutase